MFFFNLKNKKYLLMGCLLNFLLIATIYTLYPNFKSKFSHQLSGCDSCAEMFDIFLSDQLVGDLFMIDHRILASSLNTFDKEELFEDWKRHDGHQLINQANRTHFNDDWCQMSLGIFGKSSKGSKVSI